MPEKLAPQMENSALVLQKKKKIWSKKISKCNKPVDEIQSKCDYISCPKKLSPKKRARWDPCSIIFKFLTPFSFF